MSDSNGLGVAVLNVIFPVKGAERLPPFGWIVVFGIGSVLLGLPLTVLFSPSLAQRVSAETTTVLAAARVVALVALAWLIGYAVRNAIHAARTAQE